MDTEDKRRHLVVSSLFLEIVTPVLRGRLKKDYTNRGFGTLQDFLKSGPILHKLFHLRHRNSYCCKEKNNCKSPKSLPLNHCQWKILYDENPIQVSHHCFCKYTSKPVLLDDLDITLSSLLLHNVCNLATSDDQAVQQLRTYKNDYLSHNTKGEISLTEYNSLWTDTVNNILCLDPSKLDEITRLENRPIDLQLWVKYMTLVLDIYEKYEEVISMLQSINRSVTSIEARMEGCGTSMSTIETRMEGCGTSMSNMEAIVQEVVKIIKNMDTSLEGVGNSVTETNTLLRALLVGINSKFCRPMVLPQGSLTLNNLGQDIFSLHQEVKFPFNFTYERVKDIVMMDDGRLVICVPSQNNLMICYTEGRYVECIHIQSQPTSIKAVNSHTVAVVVLSSNANIEIYDIDYKIKIKSLQFSSSSILSMTTVKNKLVIGDAFRIYIINPKTGDEEQEIQPHCSSPWVLCSLGDKIYYYNDLTNHTTLYCYNIVTKEMSVTKLPDYTYIPKATPLKDGSIYLLCENRILRNSRSIIHVSSDGKDYKTVQGKGVEDYVLLQYNTVQGKLVTCTSGGIMKIFREKW